MKNILLIIGFGIAGVAAFGQSHWRDADLNTGTHRADSVDLTNLDLIIHTDCWPEENTWILQNAEGDTIYDGGPYIGMPLTEIVESFWLESGSYAFTFFDAAGDGLFGTQWGNLCSTDGSIELVDAGGNILLQYDGSYDFDSLYVAFEFDEAVNIYEQSVERIALTAYPNPFSSQLNLQLNTAEQMNLVLEIISLDGRTVMQNSLGATPIGESTQALDLSVLNRGHYLLRVSDGIHQIVKPIVKTN